MVGAAIGAAAQVGSSIYGAIKSSQALKDLRDKIGYVRKENKKWYDEAMAEDYLTRPEVRDVVRKDTEMLSEQMKRSRAINLVAGGTDESLALQQQQALEAHGDTMATIASHAAESKDEAKREYRERELALTQQEMELDQAKAQNIAAAAGQVGKAVSGLTAGLDNVKAPKAETPTVTPIETPKLKETQAQITPVTSIPQIAMSDADKAEIEKYNA